MQELESHLKRFYQDSEDTRSVSVTKIGEGFNASGYSVKRQTDTSEETLFVRELNPSLLGAATPADQAFSLLESARDINGTLESKVYGIKKNGELVEITDIEKYISVGQHLPEGVTKFLDLIEVKDDRDEARKLAHIIEPLAMKMVDLIVSIHGDHSFELPAPADLLYSRATAAIIHNSELGRGVIDLLLSQNPQWISPEDTDLWLNLMVVCRRKLGVHPERLTKIHGDYWQANVYFTDNADIITGDIRTGWGEPADDVVSMVADFCAHDLIQFGTFGQDFTQLSQRMLEKYVSERSDPEIYKYMSLKYGFKTLAESIFTPNISDNLRKVLFATGIGALTASIDGENFDLSQLTRYAQVGIKKLY